MENKNIVCIAFLLFFGFVSSELSAQSTSNDNRIFGTWICENDGSTWIFNSDGTGAGGGMLSNKTFKYAAINGIIAISTGNSMGDWVGGDYAISNDSKTLIIKLSMWGLWFKKRNS